MVSDDEDLLPFLFLSFLGMSVFIACANFLSAVLTFEFEPTEDDAQAGGAGGDEEKEVATPATPPKYGKFPLGDFLRKTAVALLILGLQMLMAWVGGLCLRAIESPAAEQSIAEYEADVGALEAVNDPEKTIHLPYDPHHPYNPRNPRDPRNPRNPTDQPPGQQHNPMSK